MDILIWWLIVYLICGVAYFISSNILYYFHKETPEEIEQGEREYQEHKAAYDDLPLSLAVLDILKSLTVAAFCLILGWPYYLLGLDE